ncbi:type II secretion system F family protein [Saccharopolyspora endophytica]|uniref:Type II secretion system F family protein n=1 Tax=Saccharopolyspora endophytica TaxID=543886 RepID=A0ABS5DK73_9PSEU|nr:type II secretion system F family protein [Saccharopolyspora endophytica]MBQ0926690.1 type II secretion system F family protein [Saccharopolyspora endophytica]
MTTSALLAALCGLGMALGALLLIGGLRGHIPASTTTPSRWRERVRHLRDGASARRPVISLAAGVLSVLVTGWVIGGVLTAAAVWSLPQVLGRDTEQAHRLARIEAIAAWTEMVRDTLSAAAGLEQAIQATVETAPAAIRDDVRELAMRIERGTLPDALEGLAFDLSDPTGDLVVSALVLACQRQARQLADLLGELAIEAREQVSMRLRVEAGRARTRTSVRVIVATTLVFAAGLVLLNRGYLAPYDGVFGQTMLLAVGALFAVAFAWLARIARMQEPERFLTRPTAAGARTEVPS